MDIVGHRLGGMFHLRERSLSPCDKVITEQNHRNARQPANGHRRVLWGRYLFFYVSFHICRSHSIVCYCNLLLLDLFKSSLIRLFSIPIKFSKQQINKMRNLFVKM